MTLDLKISVVLATYNRPGSLMKLLFDLDQQSIDRSLYEVIVIDDGSKEPIGRFLKNTKFTFSLNWLEVENGGCAKARDLGIRETNNEIVVITDDDMQFPTNFLEEHLFLHIDGASLVFGHIKWPDHLKKMQVFEKFHAHNLKRDYQGFLDGSIKLEGFRFCSGNVSFRKTDYFEVGGFDPAFTNEDRELGIALEKKGVKIVFGEKAISYHYSDHSSLRGWVSQCFQYGVTDEQIQIKHPKVKSADPFDMIFSSSGLYKYLCYIPLYIPFLGKIISHVAIIFSVFFDLIEKEKWTLKFASICFCLEYYRGVRSVIGNNLSLEKRIKSYRRKN